jgi:hypothetical protein
MQCNFFATPNDLRSVFRRVERTHQIKYTPAGLFEAVDDREFDSGVLLPTLLEKASKGSNFTYLVTPKDVSVRRREVRQVRGGIRYAVDELENPRSISLDHGGFFAEDFLIRGRVGTVSNDRSANRLFAAFRAAVAKEFLKVKSFWVGAEALGMLRSGAQLKISAGASDESDLVE